MKLLIALITYNRLEYTKRTLRTLWDTIELPHYLVIVDNNSSDGTQDYLTKLKARGRCDKIILNPDNYYPGKATNIAWTEGLKEYPEATHLCRIDNDMHFEKGWDTKAEEYFNKIERLGQLGLDWYGGEGKEPEIIDGMGLNRWPGIVGGPNIIKRKIFDVGLRYDESKWKNSGNRLQEDSKFSHKIGEYGYLIGHMEDKLSYTFANMDNWKDYKDYYIETMNDRGYLENVEYLKSLED